MSPNKIFISYSHKDADFVARLRSDLHASGLDIWIDHEALSPGTGNWDKAIREGIESSFAVIYIASENAYESNFCQGELSVQYPVIVWRSLRRLRHTFVCLNQQKFQQFVAASIIELRRISL